MTWAIQVLQTRIANLRKMEVSENIAKEIENLEALIIEIEVKINDHKEVEKGVYVEKEVSEFPGETLVF